MGAMSVVNYKESIELVNKLGELLGLPTNLTSIQINWRVNDVVKVNCSFLPEPVNKVGIGKMKLNAEVFREFLLKKPEDIEVVNVTPALFSLVSKDPIWVVLKGPQIPTISADDEIYCNITRTEDGTYEFDFHSV
jgi:hypothetical protein